MSKYEEQCLCRLWDHTSTLQEISANRLNFNILTADTCAISGTIRGDMTTIDPKPANQASFVEIDDDRAGQRIDNFLITQLKGVPKSHVYRVLRKGEVRVNKGRIKASYRLQAGDMVRIPPVRQSDASPVLKPQVSVLKAIEQSVLYEDKGLLIINKPSGLAVHGGSGLSYGVIEALRAMRPDAHYLELVHRLDRETSGCLIIAKKRSALRYLHELLRGESDGAGIEKHYLALVKGQWRGGSRRVDAPLQKNTLRSGERMVRVDQGGKKALSIFSPVEVYRDCSLMDVELKTGRTHQIRVHAAHIGHPIAMDEKYGDESFNRLIKEQGLRRLFLHARSLSFSDPDSGEMITVTAPLETDLENLLRSV